MKPDPDGWIDPPVLICLLGTFRVLKIGSEVPIRYGGKAAILLSSLALRDRHHAPRESLIEVLWPQRDAAHSAHALSSLVHWLRDLLGDALGGAPAVLYTSGGYSLNMSAGVGIDIARFDAFVDLAERHLRDGNVQAAVRLWHSAISVYRGDLCVIDDIRALAERERLRALYLSLLSRLADEYFRASDYRTALGFTRRLLAHDPCREDAHRLVMRCHVRLGERAQALRQYATCCHILTAEFDARPEPLTDALYDRVRLDPASI